MLLTSIESPLSDDLRYGSRCVRERECVASVHFYVSLPDIMRASLGIELTNDVQPAWDQTFECVYHQVVVNQGPKK